MCLDSTIATRLGPFAALGWVWKTRSVADLTQLFQKLFGGDSAPGSLRTCLWRCCRSEMPTHAVESMDANLAEQLGPVIGHIDRACQSPSLRPRKAVSRGRNSRWLWLGSSNPCDCVSPHGATWPSFWMGLCRACRVFLLRHSVARTYHRVAGQVTDEQLEQAQICPDRERWIVLRIWSSFRPTCWFVQFHREPPHCGLVTPG